MVDSSNFARAMAAHLRQPGALQPAANKSGEQVENGRRYVVLANTHETLAVYRVKTDGRLRKLKRWPAVLDER